MPEFVKVNNTLIHYHYIQNRSQERTIVFINSLGTDFRIWENVVDNLKPFANILLADKRGHGLSQQVDHTNGLNDFADDVFALLDYLKIEKNVIPVGLSVGGMIAQVMAGQRPQMLEKIIFCDTRHKIGNAQIWNDRINVLRERGMTAISSGVMERWFPPQFHIQFPDKISGYVNMLERMPVMGYIQTCEAIRDADLTEIARTIKIPSLCVVGSEDKSTLPAEVKNLADLIEGSRYEVIEGSGHIPCIDNPEILSQLIIDFIEHGK